MVSMGRTVLMNYKKHASLYHRQQKKISFYFQSYKAMGFVLLTLVTEKCDLHLPEFK